MSEYIEREAAKLRIFEYGVKHRDNANIASACENLERQISAIPAADVRPVVRGKWKKVGTQMHLNLDNAREQYRELGYPHRNIECLQCSNCRMVSMVDESIRYEFCPHCGADMREES